MQDDLTASPLVSTAWLAEHLHDPDLRVVDVRWRSRYDNGRGISFDDLDDYLAGHLPGAVFAGMAADLSDPDQAVPDMLAKPERFARVMSRLGIGDDTLVIAYDNTGFPLGAARLWWALSYYGHERVRVLDGGLRQWQAENRPLSTETPLVQPALFTPRVRPYWLASKQDVVEALDLPDTVIVDCLPADLFAGGGDRHLWGQRPGHIPGARNVPYLANVDPALASVSTEERDRLLARLDSFTFAPDATLAKLYRDAGVTPDREVIAYCGRGYAASCGLLALRHLGYERIRLYDGCWAEWSADPGLPAEVGMT